MDGLLGQSDGVIRLAVFAFVFVVMALIELAAPKRTPVAPKGRRWFTNLGISVTATVLTASGAASVAASTSFVERSHTAGAGCKPFPIPHRAARSACRKVA